MNQFIEAVTFVIVLVVGIFAIVVILMAILGTIHTRMLILSVNRHLELNRYRTAEELRAAMAREPYMLFSPSAIQIERLALSVAVRSGTAVMRQCQHLPGTREYMRALPPARPPSRRWRYR